LIQEAIRILVDGGDLAPEVISASLKEVVDGVATPAQVGGFLVALRKKGETVEEMTAFASALRGYSLQIHPVVKGRLIDTCGTGGDKVKTLNVSTISAFVAAGAGANVAKHGGRSVTSKSGSADLLEKLGLNLGLEPAKVRESIEKVGIGFMFAPSFHPAMRQVAPVRRELAVRTVFNLMGPLINPASADAQLLGVYSPELVPKVAAVLSRLETEEAIVVHGMEGIDEISVTGKTMVSWLKDRKTMTREFAPREFGVGPPSSGPRPVKDADEAATVALEVLDGTCPDEAGRLMVLVNASASIVLAQKAEGFAEGVELARSSIEGGKAMKKLEETIKFSGGSMQRLEEYAKHK